LRPALKKTASSLNAWMIFTSKITSKIEIKFGRKDKVLIFASRLKKHALLKHQISHKISLTALR